MFKDKLKRADLLLLLFFVAYCAAVVLRVHVEATAYTTIDSSYYLEAARSLKEGEWFSIRVLHGPDKNKIIPFTAWPAGYPVLIAATSWLTGSQLLWASKVTNLVFAGFGFLLLRNINRDYSFVLASMYAAFTFIEIYSYTWSEPVFLFGCLCLMVILHRIYTNGNTLQVYLLLGISVFLFLTRYIGFFAGGFTLLLAIVTRSQNRKNLSNHLFLVFTLNVLFVLAYIIHNYYVAGYNTDLQCLTPEMESIPEALWLTVKGLVIELFLIRKYYLKGNIDILTVTVTALQIAATGYIIWLLKPHLTAVKTKVKQNTLSKTAIAVAAAYLVVLIVLRSISQFDAPDYRLLSPVSMLLLFAVLNWLVIIPDTLKGAKQAKYMVFAFFILSLLLNLPKEYILSHFKQML